MFNPVELRKDFPILQRKINGKPLIYLDSGATSLKPQPMLDAMWKYYTTYSANIHRGIYQISEEATAAYDEAREKVASFIGTSNKNEIVFTRNTTEALNLVASTLGKMIIKPDNNVVTTILEHHANFIPWQQLAKEKHAKFIVIPLKKDGIIEQSLLQQYITPDTKIFAFSAVSNVLGTIQDVKEIIHTVRTLAPKCVIIVDAAQAIPHMVVDVSAWDADFVAFSGHKLLGPTGIGVLWGKYKLLEAMPPYQFGGDMIKEVHIEETIFALPPQKFEAGTPDIAEAIGLGAAVEYISSLGMNEVQHHESLLVDYALNKIREIEDITVYGPEDSHQRGGIISFTMKGIHPHDIAQVLADENICIRAGHHCAMPLHTSLNIAATARISFYVYTTEHDIDIFIEGIKKVRTIFKN